MAWALHRQVRSTPRLFAKTISNCPEPGKARENLRFKYFSKGKRIGFRCLCIGQGHFCLLVLSVIISCFVFCGPGKSTENSVVYLISKSMWTREGPGKLFLIFLVILSSGVVWAREGREGLPDASRQYPLNRFDSPQKPSWSPLKRLTSPLYKLLHPPP